MGRVSRELRYHHPDELRNHPWPEWDDITRSGPDDDDDDDDDDGGSGVREPRNPLPRGGQGAAAERPGS